MTSRLPSPIIISGRSGAAFWLAVSALVLFAPAFAAGGDPPSIGSIQEFTYRSSMGRRDPSNVVWRQPINGLGANGVLIGIKDVQAQSADYLIAVRRRSDAEDELMLSPSDGPMLGGRWISLMGTGEALIEVRSTSGRVPKMNFKYAVAVAKPAGRPFSFQYPPRFEELRSVNDGVVERAAQSVGALFWADRGEWKVCSGFRISPRHFLSNKHCVSTEGQCGSATVYFKYRIGDDGGIQYDSISQCKRVIRTEAMDALDVTVLEITGENDQPFLKLMSRALKTSEPLVMLQHPSGLPMKIVRSGCGVELWPAVSPTSVKKDDLAHQCDTAEGSSGAPLIDSKGAVVAVHHWGYVATDTDFKSYNRAIWVSNPLKEFVDGIGAGR